MYYTARVFREGKHWLAEFPDAPGCQTFAPSLAELGPAAKEALEGWLEAHLVGGDAPPKPRARRASRGKSLRVHVDPQIATAMHIRWARLTVGLTQAQLAKLVGVSQQQIAKLESPGENPTLRTVVKVFGSLGLEVEVSVEPAA